MLMLDQCRNNVKLSARDTQGINLKSGQKYTLQLESKLIACLSLSHEADYLIGVASKAIGHIKISARGRNLCLKIEAVSDIKVCLDSTLLEEIISIVLLFTEDFEYAIMSEDGYLLDVR